LAAGAFGGNVLGPEANPMWAVSMLACMGDQVEGPKRIVGTWEVHQVELPEGVVEGEVAATAGHPGCGWGRQLLAFEESAGAPAGADLAPGWISVTTDVLCPTEAPGEMFGCTVTARAPAAWDLRAGKWVVPAGAVVESRTRPLDEAAIASGTTCRAEVATGDHLVVPVRGEKWKWEMRTPDGKVLRLRAPDHEKPDFVEAMRRTNWDRLA
jgi:hypothetical protein